MVRIKEWTDEEIERLRQLYTSSKTFDEITEKFPSRTDNAIRLKASRLGLKRPLLGEIIQLKPLTYKSGRKDGSSGYLIKCKKCGSWIQVNEDTQGDFGIVSCGECGNYYQVLSDF
jgi:predicted Zn finger-like uncharacterized protein